MKRIIATLLIAMTVLTMLPPGAFAFGLREAEGVKSGVYTAGDGAVYTILYNDYITLYVNTLDGGFAVLPATESFDSAKPLSHATFRIDGEAYDYGAYYSGMSGAVGIAPQTSENGILESHWQIGDFIVSQYFAVTSDTEHSNSYAVKVGYSAQYFGEGAANIAGRILLDTQFTPDESVPVMLLDGEDNAALIESAAALNAVPASAFVSKEFIEESNLESESPVFADSPNKGYLLFDDTAFAAPDGVTFAAFDEACDADYDYTPADIALFDGSGADSAALLYWSEVSVSQGNQATFGTNYGFYDLKRGDPHFDPAPELTSESATFALLSEGVQSATVIINRLNAPESWFSMNASVSLSDTTAEYDEYVTYLQGIVTAAADLTIQLAYKPDTPQIIQDGVRKVMIEAHWDGGGEDWSWSNYELIEGEMIEREEILIGSSATIPMAEAFTHRKADEDLSIAIIPIVEAPAGYAYVTLNTAGSLNGATVSLSGSDVTEYYDSVFYGRYYFAKQSSTAKLNMEMESLAYGPWSAEGYPSIRWDYGEPTTLTAGGGDLAGPLNYTYTFTVPNNAETGAIAAGITTVSTEPNPVNIKAYSTSYTVQTVETALWGAISGVSEGGGLKWATPSTTVTVNSSALSSYSGYKLYVYKAGTKTSALTGNETGEITNTNSFTMPGEPVDLVYEQGNNYRVLTTVSGEGTATVVVDSAHGSRPQSGDEVYVYMTNIEGGYSLEKVEATGATLAAQAGGAHKFTMPADSDVTVTATLESSDDVSAEMHSITVKPLAGDGMLRFDVAFWTDTASGARKLYEVDEAGRLGRVRTGTTVYYALYPTTWAIDTNSLSDMDNWVVSGLTMNGVTPEGFTEITGPGYFPTSYNPSNANSTAGTFTMPDEDVILELTGYKKTKVYSLTLEAYDEYGNRLSLPENTVRSAAVDPTKVYDSTNFTAPPWNEGLNVEAFMDKFLRLEAPQQFDRYTLESAAVMTGGATTMALTPLGGTWQADWPVSGLVARYYFQPMFQNNAIVRLTYAVKYNRLNITGFEPQEWNVYRPGEVRVYEGSGRSETRALNVLRDGEGKGAIELTLDWSRMGDGIDYMLPASGDGFTTSFLHSKGGSATYSVTVTKPEATIAIQEKPVAPSLGLSDGVSFNSANSNTFKTVNLHAGYYKLDADGKSGYSENLKNLLNGNPAPKITEMTLASEKTQEGFPKNVTGDVYANNNAAFSWPQNEFRDDFTGARNGQLMALDLRSLFGIDGEYSFPEGNYTLTVKWSYGDGLRESGEKSYTFYLSPTIYAPGELTHIGIVKVDHIYPEDMRAHPGIERGNWIVVTGVSNEDMMKTAGRISDSPPLLTFVNDSSNGFFVGYEDHDYWAQGTIVMNGHAYFKNLPSGAGEFYIDEDNGSVTIESYEMTFGGKIIPVWLPIQIGSNNGVRFGTNTLKIDIEKYKNYTIPYEIPEYHKGNAANAEDAKAKWQAEVDALRENTVTIYPDLEGAAWSGGNQVESGDPDDIPAELRWTGNSVALKIGDYELEGLTADYREIYLLGHGFDIGGQINVQIPGTKDPIFRVELVSLVTDNTARLIPIDNVWAEGEGTVKLPDAIGGYGGQASGVFNTFTQDFGFEAMINFKVIELAGELYLARSERFKIPVLDRYVVSIGLDGLGVGAGLPPVPVQIIEINGIKVGVTNLADTFDYDPRKNTIPSMRIIIGGKFKLVEVLGFEAEMWSEMFSGGFSVEGNLEIGPFSFPLIKELSLEYGMKDGPFEEYEDAGTIVKGKRSLLFFINAKCHVSLLGIVDGAGGFSVNMTISPFLWEKRGGFKSVQEVFDFLKFSITANGYLYASLNVPLTDWTIADADVRVDIVFEPGLDMDVMPIGFRQFEFVATERFLGMRVSEDRIDLMKYYGSLKDWLAKEVEKQKKNKTQSYAAQSLSAQSLSEDASMLQLMAMNTFLADPEASGLEPDPNYQGEHRNLAFGNTVADSERGIAAPVQSGRMLRAIAQDTAHITVEAGVSSYTHSVTVPSDGKDYVLQMEGYGSDALTFADVQIFKPGGQALTVRELSGEVTAAQAEFGYNAAVIDGVLTLSLADFKNTTAGQKNNDTVSGVGGTLSGVWQIVSQKPFKSSLVAINAVPGVKSVGLSGSTLSMEFENVTANNGYYYDVTLERKSDADAPPLEALTIVKNAQITNASASLNLTQIKIESATDSDTYDIAAIASSGDWYPRVTLRTGKMESYTIGEDTEQFLITEYVDDKICAEPYAVVNTTLASATWTSNLQAVSGGNQSIDISFDPVETVPTDMAVSGYHVTVYNENGLPASRHATDAEGSQRATLMEYDILAGEDEPNRYEYNIPDVPTGKYAVGVSPMYADLIPETKEGKATGKSVVSAVSRKGKEEKSGAITVNAATPPTLAFSVTGGALVEENGSKYVFFADEDAALTATASGGSTVTYCEFDGTELTAAGGTLTNLSNYSGRTLIVTARNAQGDSTTEYLTLYADATAPLLLPDNYDEGNGAFTFTAYNNTGNYTITGQAAPGAAIGGVIAGDDGRFSIPGKLDDGVNSENFTLTATSAAGLVTMREVRVVRGNVNESAGTPGSSGGRSSGTANSASGGARSYTITTPDGKPAVTGADGTITLPGGGTIKTPEGVTITAPEGTTIKKDGLISIPNEKEAGIVTAGGTQITAPGGTTIALNGRVTPPRTAAATVTLSSGLELNIKEGTTIILDKNVPLGYRAVFENPFADAKAGDWFFDDVGFAYTHGLFAGTGATSFSPNTPMTRGMIVTVLHRLAAEPGADGSAPFGDVSAGQWYTDAVNWAAANGIVGGTGGGLFAPDGDITRQDMAVILMRYAERAGLKLPETRDYPGFKDDADVANYAKEALEAFFKAGIINGKPGGLFDPKGAATRAEAAAMLRRFLETQ